MRAREAKAPAAQQPQGARTTAVLSRAAAQHPLSKATGLAPLSDLRQHVEASPVVARGASLQRQATARAHPPPRQPKSDPGGLPHPLKTGVEQLSGVSMEGVTVHRNSGEPAKVGAHAYAQGRDIHLGPGQERHLPHEAWHVAQQAQGRVKPTMQAKGVAINDDASLEREADVMGAQAMSAPVRDAAAVSRGTGIQRKVIQRVLSQKDGMLLWKFCEPRFARAGVPSRLILKIWGVIKDSTDTPQEAIVYAKRIFDFYVGSITKNLHERGEHGVLLYGTENARESYRGNSLALPRETEKRGNQPSGIATIGYMTADRYSNYSWRDFPWKGKAFLSIFNPDYSEYLNQQFKDKRGATTNAIRTDLVKWTKSVVASKNLIPVLNYQSALLDHPRYSPLVTYFESDDFAVGKEMPGNSASVENSSKAKFQLQTRRASKFGIEYMKMVGGGVAFIREVSDKFGVTPKDSSFTVNKSSSENRPMGRKGLARVPITVSEERLAFRLRKDFPGLKFFSGGKEVVPPWQADRDNWGKYHVHRVKKYLELARTLGINVKGMNLEQAKFQVGKLLKEKYPDLSTGEAIAKIQSQRQVGPPFTAKL